MPKLVIQTIHCPLQVAARPCPSAHGLAEDVFRRRSPPLALALRRRLLPGGRLRTRGALAGRRVVAAALRARKEHVNGEGEGDKSTHRGRNLGHR